MEIEKFVSRVESLFVKNRGKPYEEKVAFASTDCGHFVELIFGKHSLDWQSLNDGRVE